MRNGFGQSAVLRDAFCGAQRWKVEALEASSPSCHLQRRAGLPRLRGSRACSSARAGRLRHALELNALETGSLVALLEKERLTPENYPLSLNSLTRRAINRQLTR